MKAKTLYEDHRLQQKNIPLAERAKRTLCQWVAPVAAAAALIATGQPTEAQTKPREAPSVLCIGTPLGYENQAIDFKTLKEIGVKHAFFVLPKVYEKEIRALAKMEDYERHFAAEELIKKMGYDTQNPKLERLKLNGLLTEAVPKAHKSGLQIHTVDKEYSLKQEALEGIRNGSVRAQPHFIERQIYRNYSDEKLEETVKLIKEGREKNSLNFAQRQLVPHAEEIIQTAKLLREATEEIHTERSREAAIMETITARNEAIADEVARILKKTNQPGVVIGESSHTGNEKYKTLSNKKNKTKGIEKFLNENHNISAVSIDTLPTLTPYNQADKKVKSNTLSGFITKSFPNGLQTPLQNPQKENSKNRATKKPERNQISQIPEI
jgi:hypothetical protein